MTGALAATVLLASLTGSLHCAGMCGAFVAFGVGGARGGAAWRAQLAYHGGRLATYGALGALAGAAGGALDLGGAWLGIQRAALAVAAISMIAFGVATLLRLRGVRVPGLGAPPALRRLYLAGHARAVRLGPVRRALTIGLLSTLLPCGWLYAFAVVAAGSGSPWTGAAILALFWAGTVPVLAGIGAGVRALAGPARRHLPALAAIALVCVGLVALAGRARVPALTAEGVAPADLETAVEAAGERTPACCVLPE